MEVMLALNYEENVADAAPHPLEGVKVA